MADVLEHDLRKVGTGASPAAPAQALPGLISAFRSKADGIKLDRIEEKILAEDVSEGGQMLVRIRRTTVRLHRQLVILRSLIQRLGLDLGQKFALGLATKTLGQRLQEEVTIKTVLAIVTTVFLPATLIAGVFGMNVGGLPLTQSGHGFLWPMVILVGASAAVFWLLKRSGILRR